MHNVFTMVIYLAMPDFLKRFMYLNRSTVRAIFATEHSLFCLFFHYYSLCSVEDNMIYSRREYLFRYFLLFIFFLSFDDVFKRAFTNTYCPIDLLITTRSIIFDVTLRLIDFYQWPIVEELFMYYFIPLSRSRIAPRKERFYSDEKHRKINFSKLVWCFCFCFVFNFWILSPSLSLRRERWTFSSIHIYICNIYIYI